MTFSLKSRTESIAKMKLELLDVLIIGGGITGSGVALQASACQMKTGLIEMQDFAEGTSSRSTKLVHGGIRYLKNFDVEVVADTVKERAVLQQIAPHIPRADPMLLPIYDEPKATFNLFSIKVAMDFYDQLANVTGTKLENHLLTKEEVLQLEPQLNPKGLLGGGVYLDFRNNDARLVIENLKQAAADGGYLVNRVQAVGFLLNEKGKVIGVQAKDLLNDEQFQIRAHVVINTTGPWSDKVRALDKQEDVIPMIRPTKGVHLVVDNKKLNVLQPTYFDSGQQDGRMIFVIPRENKTYFGTTDTDFHGDYQHPTVEQEDVDYLLEVINHRYPVARLTIHDIEASWVGLRPLIATNSGSDYNGGNKGRVADASFHKVIQVVEKYLNKQVTRLEVEQVLNNLDVALSETDSHPSAISRGSILEVAENGLLTLAGGKITDYRKMAKGALKVIQKRLAAEFQKSFTLIDSTKYPVSGGNLNPLQVEEELHELALLGMEKGLAEEDAHELAHLYGSNTEQVLERIDKISPTSSLSLKETIGLHYAMEEELTLTPADYLIRRTNHLLFRRDTLDQVKQDVIEEMAAYYNWSLAKQEEYQAQLNKAILESDLTALKADMS